jgi:hypothetical protein
MDPVYFSTFEIISVKSGNVVAVFEVLVDVWNGKRVV